MEGDGRRRHGWRFCCEKILGVGNLGRGRGAGVVRVGAGGEIVGDRAGLGKKWKNGGGSRREWRHRMWAGGAPFCIPCVIWPWLESHRLSMLGMRNAVTDVLCIDYLKVFRCAVDRHIESYP